MHCVLMSVLVLVGWVTPSTAGLKSSTDTDLIIMVVQGDPNGMPAMLDSQSRLAGCAARKMLFGLSR